MPADQPPDLSPPRHLHVVGIGGTGMSAIAEVLLALGHRVSGSDRRDGPVLERLRTLGIDARAGQAPELAAAADGVTVSTAVPGDDPDVAAARAAGCPVWARADVLAAICRLRRTVAVAGTHGKTTTASMLATILAGAGRRPSWLIGAALRATGSGAAWDGGEWLVVEADESDGTLLRLPAEVAVVTSVEADHLEHWGGLPGLVEGFARFLAGATGWSLACADDPVAADLGAAAGSRTYGTGAAAYRMAGLAATPEGSRFSLELDGAPLGEAVVPVPGDHNARNAAAALAVAHGLGVPFGQAVAALRGFAGVARRFEPRGRRDGVTFVDDYAHHPSEVAAALAAARAGGWDRIVCAFQPHRFSRTAELAGGFAGAFAGADVLAVTDIYAAGEPPRPGVSAKLVVDAVAASADRPGRLLWLPERSALVAFLRRELRAGDLCLTLNAGDLTTLPDELGARR